METKDIDFSKLSPMMKQYFEVKNKYKNHILFYRLGDFYEMFFDDAIIASRELELPRVSFAVSGWYGSQ